MALVELRRFYDRNEAYIAQATLENDGVFSVVRDNGYANLIFGAAIATGGYGLLVLDDDVAQARAILVQAVPPSPEALNWTDHPQHLSALPLAAIGTASGMVTGAPTLIGSSRRVTWIGVLGTAAAVLVLLCFLGALFGAI
jgi:hypothetical protein